MKRMLSCKFNMMNLHLTKVLYFTVLLGVFIMICAPMFSGQMIKMRCTSGL